MHWSTTRLRCIPCRHFFRCITYTHDVCWIRYRLVFRCIPCRHIFDFSLTLYMHRNVFISFKHMRTCIPHRLMLDAIPCRNIRKCTSLGHILRFLHNRHMFRCISFHFPPFSCMFPFNAFIRDTHLPYLFATSWDALFHTDTCIILFRHACSWFILNTFVDAFLKTPVCRCISRL
jgi:hypothetical protein